MSNKYAPFKSPYASGYGLMFPESQIVSGIYQFVNFEEFNHKSVRILDLGCGLGNHALLLEVLDAEYVGIDIDPFAIERAKQIFSKKPYAEKITFKNTSLIDFSPESDYPSSFTIIIDRASLQHNSSVDLISSNGLFARIAMGLNPEKGIFVSYWASKRNDFNSMTQRFSIFTGFEDISRGSTSFFELLSQKRITAQEVGGFKRKETSKTITNFLLVWKIASQC